MLHPEATIGSEDSTGLIHTSQRPQEPQVYTE